MMDEFKGAADQSLGFVACTFQIRIYQGDYA